jgi:hypothetical protein
VVVVVVDVLVRREDLEIVLQHPHLKEIMVEMQEVAQEELAEVGLLVAQEPPVRQAQVVREVMV